MREVRLSNRAVSDLASIADYTIAEFGISQARRYRGLIDACFESIRRNPELGRTAENVAPALRRIRQQAHVIFYKVRRDEILIVRVLHEHMDFTRHL